MSNKKILIFLLISAPLSISRAYANSTNGIVEYSLQLSNIKSNFKFDSNNSYETQLNQLGINWYESFSPYFQAGLEVGYSEMTQLNNSVSSAQFTSGQYAGLLLRFVPLHTKYLSANLNLNYRYNKSDSKTKIQESRIIWNNTMLSAELQAHLSSQLSLFVSTEYQNIEGTQQDIGIINQTRAFKGEKQQNYRIGFEFEANRSSFIRVEWVSGLISGTQIHLMRKF